MTNHDFRSAGAIAARVAAIRRARAAAVIVAGADGPFNVLITKAQAIRLVKTGQFTVAADDDVAILDRPLEGGNDL